MTHGEATHRVIAGPGRGGTATGARAGDADVVIVGAGPTGLTLACELFRLGVPCRVLDRARAPSADSRATDIHSRTLELLDRLGAAGPLAARGRTVRAFNAFAGGRVVSRLDFENLRSPFPFTVAVPQKDTEEVLLDRLRAEGGQVERGVEVFAIAQHSSGAELTVSAGGLTERVRCRYVVGCDGVHSAVRRAAGIPYGGLTYPERYAVADVDLAWSLPNDEVHLFMTPGGFCNVVALPGGPRRGRVLCDLSPGQRRDVSFETVQRLFERRTGGLGRLESPTFLRSFRIHRRLAATFRRGSVLLAGDAAHACSPLLGQGMNLGIQSAFNLGWKLAMVCRGEAPAALLDSYEAERRPVARTILRHTDFLHRVTRLSPAWARGVRDAAVAVLSHLEVSRSHAAMTCSALGVAYPTSPIVGSAQRTGPLRVAASVIEYALSRIRRPGAPAAGERAPDLAPGPGGERLLPERSGRHTALVFLADGSPGEHLGALAALGALARARGPARDDGRGPAVEVRAVVRGGPGPVPAVDGVTFLHDVAGRAHDAYGVARPTLFVVRPDAYVAATSEPPDPDTLARYLSRVLGWNGGGA